MYRCFLILVLSVGLFACGEYEALEVQRVSQQYADSLFRAHRDSLTAHFDSLCHINYPKYYKVGVDSFKVVQLEKIQK